MKFTLTVPITVKGHSTSPDKLVQLPDLVHVGAFKLPHGTQPGGSSFDYGATAMVYDDQKGTLRLVGHDWQQYTTEITIPVYFKFPLTDWSVLNTLATAKMVGPFADPFELNGGLNPVTSHTSDSVKVGGQLIDGNRLIVTAYVYYDGSGEQRLSHFVRPANMLMKGSVSGPFMVNAQVAGPNGRPMNPAGFVSGYMARVPPDWQTKLGGIALTGNGDLSIISRSSDGPAVCVFDPAQVGQTNPVPATVLLAYPPQHPLPSNSPSGVPWNNRTCQVNGCVFPDGTRSVLFFGRMGTGAYAYGEGTANRALDGTRTPGGTADSLYVYDPADVGGKGGHAYPYSYVVWAYDAEELAKVKAGQKTYWEVRPYAVWTLPLPFPVINAQIKGAAWDRANRRLFVSQAWGDGSYPLIHVYQVN